MGLYHLPDVNMKLFMFTQTAYEQAKRVHEAASDLFKKLTKIMIDCAAHIGSDFSFTRKVREKRNNSCWFLKLVNCKFSSTSASFQIPAVV